MNHAPEPVIGHLYLGSNLNSFKDTIYHVSNVSLPSGFILSSNSPERPHLIFFDDSVPRKYSNNSDFLARKQVESIFETIRKSQFTTMPSRKNCIFANFSKSSALAWKDKATRAKGSVYRLTVSDSSKIVVLDLCFYNYAVRVAKGLVVLSDFLFKKTTVEIEIQESASYYWSGKSGAELGIQSGLEALIEGTATAGEELK